MIFGNFCINNAGFINSGVSFFYPIKAGEDEIREYISLGICEEYNNFLSTYYLNVPEKTISFSDKGSIGEDGSFSIALTKDSHKYLAEAGYYLVNIDAAGIPQILCSDTDKALWIPSTAFSALLSGSLFTASATFRKITSSCSA